MRVALYYPWIYLKSGLERTILEIARRSRHELRIYTSHYDAEGTYPELGRFGIREVDRVSVQRSYGAVMAAGRDIARTRLDLADVDALVVCCEGLGTFIMLRNASVPALNLCFTPLRAVYDLEYRRRHLGRRRGARRLLALAVERAYRVVDRWLWRRYRAVVCISETVRERVAAGRLWPRDQVLVRYPGVDAEAISEGERFERYFFLPGRIMWTKNIELGIEAFLEFRRSGGAGYRLVVAGMVDAKGQDYLARLRGLAAQEPAIEFRIGLTDAEMGELYANCTAVLFTAFNEDLGLTPLEAMARGKPVIAVDRGGPRESVVHAVTGLLADPDPASFAAAMRGLTDDDARLRAMGRAGLERVRTFTWQSFVRGLDDDIERMVVESRS